MRDDARPGETQKIVEYRDVVPRNAAREIARIVIRTVAEISLAVIRGNSGVKSSTRLVVVLGD